MYTRTHIYIYIIYIYVSYISYIDIESGFKTLNLKYKHALLLYSTIFVFALFMFVYVSFTPLALTIKDRRLY